MIYITRPVTETHKTVPKTTDKSLDNNLRERRPMSNIGRDMGPKERDDYHKDELEKAIEETNKIIFRDNSRFEFKLHEGTGRMMVKLIDKETDEIIKEIPPEKILDLVASIWDLVGILVDERG